MIRIENWAVGSSNIDPYTPPELAVRQLQGNVYGHPRFPEGYFVTTSRIVAVEGRKVTTYSGSVYELGTPDPQFVEWCRANGVHVPTEEEPIKVHL